MSGIKLTGRMIKYDLRAQLRVAVFPIIILFITAIICRISIAAASSPDSVINALGLLAGLYFVALIATPVTCLIMGLSNFGRSLFTGEGLMTFSLPMTATQIILSKLLSAIIVTFIGIASLALSGCIFLIGLPAEIYEEIGTAFGQLMEILQAYYSGDPLLIFEEVLKTLTGIPLVYLVVFACMSFGQMFVKHRKLFTALLIIGIYVIETMIASPLARVEFQNPHVGNWLLICIELAIDVGCFFFVRYVLTHKVNLLV